VFRTPRRGEGRSRTPARWTASTSHGLVFMRRAARFIRQMDDGTRMRKFQRALGTSRTFRFCYPRSARKERWSSGTSRNGEHRKPFFAPAPGSPSKQVGRRHVLLRHSDDYLARLDRQAISLWNGFNIRYRLERLRDVFASDAIQRQLSSFEGTIMAGGRAHHPRRWSPRPSDDTRPAARGRGVNEFHEPLELQISYAGTQWARSRKQELRSERRKRE